VVESLLVILEFCKFKGCFLVLFNDALSTGYYMATSGGMNNKVFPLSHGSGCGSLNVISIRLKHQLMEPTTTCQYSQLPNQELNPGPHKKEY
jgi:hypothetical protein